MRRDLERLSRDTFDLLVIGGGITGACIARDAALRGLSVALIEKNDFAHATSAHNSKLIHGGLRYLRNLEFSLVRESLKERRIWQRTAPHLVRPLRFLVPLSNGGWRSRATLAAGLSLYDLLSYDRGWLDDPAQRLPGHRWLDRNAALAEEAMLDGPRFEGAYFYSDAQMYAPERLAWECVLDAGLHGAAAANHLEAETLLLRNGRIGGATVRDTLDSSHFDIRANLTVLAAGPWADIFLSRALSGAPRHRLVRSKGIHLIVPAMTRGYALTVATAAGHFFVLPWRGHSILGTTDTAFEGSPDEIDVDESEIANFLATVNRHLPAAKLDRADVRYVYAGLRPLVDDGTGNTYGASRRAELIDHAATDQVDGLMSVIGGKWTTSRNLAARVVTYALARSGKPARTCVTAHTPLPGGRIDRIDTFTNSMREKHPAIAGIDHLARLYGTGLGRMLDLTQSNPRLGAELGTAGDIGAGIVHAVREEMAVTLEDAVMRRTGLGQLGHPGEGVLAAAAELMANELGWSGDRKRAEIELVARTFKATPGMKP